MQRWEYCRMLYDGTTKEYWLLHYQLSGHVVRRVKREEAKGDEDDTTAWWRTIAELGRDGWELVSAYQDTTASHHLYFKRLLPDVSQSA